MKQTKRFFVILAGIVCFSGICLADKSGSLVVSPGSDVSWGCVLKPYETATLTITVAAPPPGYRLKNKTVAITSSSPDFCWGGGYSVVNSAGISATTRVTVSCVWEPIPGGGGPGTPPPNLYGSATGIANAQPGEYWNVADASVLAVGNSVSVKAYKNDSEPAPSAWSISGPATIAGAGASATVAGTAPSASEFDVIVHSVCNETGQTDDELLTVVGVKSIKADPDVVCVGKDVSYEIETQPAGYNYMVLYTPADTSTPGVKQVVATCGTSAATCTVSVVKVEITPSAVNATESLDSGTFTCTVTPSGLSPTYQWLTGSDNDAWPATAGNDPELDYSASTASSTIVNGTRWFTPTPSRRQVIDGVTCSYNVNCEVTVGGTKCRASTPATLSVTVNMTGQTTGCVFQNWDTITVAQTGGVWNVTGQGSFSRSAPVASVNMPATSQFHDKAMVHENKHVEQWMTGMFKDLKNANGLYNSTLSTLTSTNSEADLRAQIDAAVQTQIVDDNAIYDSKICDAEKEAFDAMNAVAPDFLEMDDADWKPLYGCQ